MNGRLEHGKLIITSMDDVGLADIPFHIRYAYIAYVSIPPPENVQLMEWRPSPTEHKCQMSLSSGYS
jgi:hypothetical protein